MWKLMPYFSFEILKLLFISDESIIQLPQGIFVMIPCLIDILSHIDTKKKILQANGRKEK